jgi:hypothetical protein
MHAIQRNNSVLRTHGNRFIHLNKQPQYNSLPVPLELTVASISLTTLLLAVVFSVLFLLSRQEGTVQNKVIFILLLLPNCSSVYCVVKLCCSIFFCFFVIAPRNYASEQGTMNLVISLV